MITRMCIIAYKPKGAQLPTDAQLDAMWTYNNDGAGIAYRVNGKVYVERGLMTLTQLRNTLQKFKTIDTDLIIHFRAATSGFEDELNTHPFPIQKDLTNAPIKGETEYALAHNGMIQGVGKGFADQFSDTAWFVMKYLARTDDMDTLLNFVADTTSNRFALMGPLGVKLYGHFIEDNGVFYSNYGYETYSYGYRGSYRGKTRKTKKKKRATYDYDYNYDDYEVFKYEYDPEYFGYDDYSDVDYYDEYEKKGELEKKIRRALERLF